MNGGGNIATMQLRQMSQAVRPDCFMVRRVPPIVQLGKFGDLICILPALKALADESGEKPLVIVSEKFASVLDGVSYVEPEIVSHQWALGTGAAREYALAKYGACIVPQFWNDPTFPTEVPPGPTEVLCHNRSWWINPGKWPNFMTAMYDRLGFTQDEMMKLPCIFDRRDRGREDGLVQRLVNRKKPTLLVNLKSETSPFPFEPELMKALRLTDFQVIDISALRAERIYDLLGLFGQAAGLITCATATLHLAHASRIPYVAFIEDGWSKAIPRGNCVFSVPYSQAVENLNRVAGIVDGWRNRAKELPPLNIQDPPSVLMQTRYPCGFFDFSKSNLPMRPGLDYFNCGLVNNRGEDWLVIRRSEWRANMTFGMNDVVAFRLKGKTPAEGIPVEITSTHHEEHFEDPRVFNYKGRLFLSCTNFVWGKVWTGAHQIFVWLTDNWKTGHRYDPVIGGNGLNVSANQRSEKNWLWFFHGGNPHCIYLTFPHTVVRLNTTLQQIEQVYETKAIDLNWPWGQPRGGTPPVLVDGEYWSFFHSCIDDPYHTRRYFMGAYAFSAMPPFRITRMSRGPLMAGSNKDKWGQGKPLVVFPCGALLRNDSWFVTFGVNDLNCAWVEIPHEALLDQTVPVLYGPNSRLHNVTC